MLLSELTDLYREGGPLAALSETELTQLAEDFELVDVPAGADLLPRGEPIDQVFVVLRGHLAARVRDGHGGATPLREFCRGDLLTASGLLGGPQHAISVTAIEPCRLATLSRQRMDVMFARDSESWRRISTILLAWMRRSQLTTHLNALFGSFEPSEADTLRELESEVEMLTLAGGETLFREGDRPDAAYIVMSGRLRVVVESGYTGTQVLNEVGRGETVGELALLTDERRSATVFAVRDTDLARISQQGFHSLLERRPKSLRPLARTIADRLRRHAVGGRTDAPSGACTALVPARPSVQMTAFVGELMASLRAHGSAILLTSAEIDRTLGVPGIAQSTESSPSYARLALWLHEREDLYRFVVYLADATWTPWTERCARQSDCVLAVADTDDGPEQDDVEKRLRHRWLDARAPRRGLVLLHRANVERPRGTARWLDTRDVDAVYHVRDGHRGDIERLGRIVAGRAVGLVLGGGGGRGFAHFGVLRALEELGIPVDMIGGSSMGAPVALPCAMGQAAADGLALAERSFRKLRDYTFPIAALLAGRRITRAIERTCRDWDIEDLWLPYYCVSTDITTGRAVSHQRGSLLRAVRASVAIPGVLPPVPDGESLLVDGGVLNNLPIDVMREINPTGTVIAVDVLNPSGPRARADYGLSLSGWRLLFRLLNPLTKAIPAPSLVTTIMRSMFVGSDGARERQLRDGLANLYINIRAPGIGLLQFDDIARIASLGYDGALAPLTEWVEQQAATPLA